MAASVRWRLLRLLRSRQLRLPVNDRKECYSMWAAHRIQYQHYQCKPFSVRMISILTQDTPNPRSLKFLPGKPVLGTGTRDFPTSNSAESSPLARDLFQIEGIKSVFYGPDFITLTKTDDDVEWTDIKRHAIEVITKFFESGEAITMGATHAESSITEDDDEIVLMIKELLDTRIRYVEDEVDEVNMKVFAEVEKKLQDS
ncbi:hypothetical protein cypCar_00015222 [Cyprinus carpio]|nr:hypothetical protein cypCar_00015222 [Cyprinus carpio]